MNVELSKKGNKNGLIHGHCQKSKTGKVSSEYGSWFNMKTRCLNKNSADWTNYGGRGIKVCDRWMAFENFLQDMGLKPTPRHSLDRFPDRNGNYEPGNCRWATQSEQNLNKDGCLQEIACSFCKKVFHPRNYHIRFCSRTCMGKENSCKRKRYKGYFI